ncbi:MAG: metallophosphoesterase family protein [Labilithrix sp.]|nr:metallophosphoesterase family protein [Labilithrix sp.]MCW5815107.1 metallophosphoesterase family protein [Labilithrix sp.]
MRFGLIGDVHAEDQLLARALDAIAAAKVDRVLCTGDLVDGFGNVDRVCALLAARGVTVVRGNHDRWIRSDDLRTLPNAHRMTDLAVESIGFLKELPQTVSIDVAGGKLLLCHGVGANDMCKLGPDDYGYAISSNDDLLKVLFDPTIRVMVGGHTHKTMARRFERGTGKPPLFVVNPGTLARDHGPGYAVLDLARARVDFHALPSDGGAPTHVSTAALA